MMRQKLFWSEVIERAIKSAAQAALLGIGGDAANLFDVDALAVLGLAGGGFLISLLTSIASAQIGPKDSPSLV